MIREREVRSIMLAVVLAVALVTLMATVGASGTLAAKGGGHANVGSAASITLDQADPRLGDVVTFTWAADMIGQQAPRIQLICSQDGVIVYSGAAEARQQFLLGGGDSDWLSNGGPADCEAALYYWDFQPVQKMVVLTSTTFHAGGLR